MSDLNCITINHDTTIAQSSDPSFNKLLEAYTLLKSEHNKHQERRRYIEAERTELLERLQEERDEMNIEMATLKNKLDNTRIRHEPEYTQFQKERDDSKLKLETLQAEKDEIATNLSKLKTGYAKLKVYHDAISDIFVSDSLKYTFLLNEKGIECLRLKMNLDNLKNNHHVIKAKYNVLKAEHEKFLKKNAEQCKKEEEPKVPINQQESECKSSSSVSSVVIEIKDDKVYSVEVKNAELGTENKELKIQLETLQKNCEQAPDHHNLASFQKYVSDVERETLYSLNKDLKTQNEELKAERDILKKFKQDRIAMVKFLNGESY